MTGGKGSRSGADRAALERAALERLLAQEGLAQAATSIPVRADQGSAPLSFSQELLWLLDEATPGLTAYNGPVARRLRGALDPDVLEQCLELVVARHPSLRTTFHAGADGPVQRVSPPAAFRLERRDLRALTTNRGAALAEQLTGEAQRRFNLKQDLLLRATLYRIEDADWILQLVTHHIVADGWSLGILFREVSAAYRSLLVGTRPFFPPLPITFGDFAAWQRTRAASPDMEGHLEYWRGGLSGPLPALALPTDRPRPQTQGFAGGMARWVVSSEILGALKRLGEAQGASIYMVLIAAYQALLHRWSGQDDIIVGSPAAGRPSGETEGLVGYFNNPLIIRSRFEDDPSFTTLLTRVRETCLGAYEHQDLPFELLVLDLQTERRLSHAPLFRAVLTMQETHARDLELPEIGVSAVPVDHQSVKFDLTLLTSEHEDGLHFDLEYRSDLFDSATAERFLQHLNSILTAVAKQPATRVSLLPLLTAPERADLDRWNATARTLGRPTTIASLIQAAAARAPGHPAVASGAVTLTWGELSQRAARLARRLQDQGAGPDVPIGLCLPRSADLITGMVGILYSGSAYVPLLPDQPAARLRQQLTESGAKVVVTSSALRPLLPPDIVTVDLDDPALDALPDTAPACAATPDSLAYVLFTSGSTGVPKGVAVTHANLVHYTRAIAAELELDLTGAAEPWHAATVSTLAADLGHTSVFPALCSGGVLHVVPDEVVLDATKFKEWIAGHPIDLLKITPGHFQALVGPEADPAHLPRRWLVLGGEACPWPLAERVRAAHRCRVLNHYGPTETTVGACVFEVGIRDVSRWAPATVPIGRPLANVTTQVADAHGEPVPVGVPGELWIGGAGVARGYLGKDDLTRERFVTREGARYYRTGDRVRRLPTGDLEFLGRFDTQVKIRGHRVELGEIEAALTAEPGVEQAAVVLRDDVLTAYIVGGGPTDAALAARLGGVLPDHMVPAAWVRLPTMPLNANGKIDRAALPAPEPAMAASDDAPRTETERRMAELWAEVLKRSVVGIHENFFALGGHSLLAIRLLGKIAKTFGPRLPLRTLFDHPTVAQLVPVVEPPDPIEESLGALWAEVLKRERVGRDENFFAMGGHSLLAIRLLGKIAKTFGVRLPLRVLFEHPTVAQLAKCLVAETAPGPGQGPSGS